MIADLRVFDDEFVPPDLLHRENEIEQLLRRFTTRHPAESDVLISGPSGVGKTVLARTAVDHLETQTDVTRVFVDSLGKTTGGILRAMLEQLPRGPNEVAQTLPTRDVCREIREAITSETIVVLDEGDDLPQTNAVGELLAMANVTVVVIAHDGTDWLSRLDVTDGHRLDQGHLELGRYGVDELADILERRARQGLHGEPVSRAQLEAIADEVAGVARHGIQSLRSAAVLARERGHRRVRDRDVDDSYEHARHRIRKLNLSSLPFHHQVLYAIIHEAEELSASELHDRYDAVSGDIYAGSPPQPLGERARREKLSKLAEYDLIDYDGPTRDRLYWVIDSDVEPLLELPGRMPLE
ncbi:Cdc6/Cdc18 family protein [Halostagnicola kamekurae]|uniref:Cdc6-related protein, AAA superfamily ATPase n=1 Tax=Halostagnicola kamekurae TaxID=619731 RepID=A0A1I6RFM4_9EURY|nr:AAA family ATPase [Halostagnicola kamekurae]SFS63529.1 Cdc6-related protein, AAA superfamily ATPase [Halostagnicola kamekurae]